MQSDPGVSQVTPMAGDGAYNRNAMVQAAQATAIIPLLQAAVGRIACAPDGPPLLVADYGCAQGANSLGPMRAAILALRARAGSDRAVMVMHNDLPGNDFASLFTLLENDPASYLRTEANVFASAVGRSFFEQVLPADSVTVGWSSNSLHWFSHVPQAAPDVWYPADTQDPQASGAFLHQSDADWRAFLNARSAELRVGGRLIVMMAGEQEDGLPTWGTMRRHLQAERVELLATGEIDKSQIANMLIPNRPRTRTELLAPFAANGRFAGLAVAHADIAEAPDAIWDSFRESGDAVAYGARWGAVFRVTLAPSLVGALDPSLRPGLTNRLESGLARRFAAAPEPSPMTVARVVLAKVGETEDLTP